MPRAGERPHGHGGAPLRPGAQRGQSRRTRVGSGRVGCARPRFSRGALRYPTLRGSFFTPAKGGIMTGVKEGGGGEARARRRRSASSTASTAVATAVVSEAQARGSAGGRVRGPGRVRRLSTGRGDSTGGLGAGEARQWVSGSPECSGGVNVAPSEWKRVSGEEAGNGWKQNLLAPERQAGPAASTSRGSRRPSWRCGRLAGWGGADGRSTQEHKPPRFRLERGPQTRGGRETAPG